MLTGRQAPVGWLGQASHNILPTRTCEGGASTSGRQHVSHSQRHRSRNTPPACHSVAAPDREQVQLAEQSQTLSVNSAAAAPLLRDPDTFTLNSGELSTIAQSSTAHPADIFRCAGCKLEECQVRCVQCSMTSSMYAGVTGHMTLHCCSGTCWLCQNGMAPVT